MAFLGKSLCFLALAYCLYRAVGLTWDDLDAKNTALAAQRQRVWEDAILAIPGRYHRGEIELDNIPPWVWLEIARIERSRTQQRI